MNLRPALYLGLWLAAPPGLSAQELDCANAVSQVEMTGCAARAYEAADADLNLAYGLAMDRARQLDEGLPDSEIPAATFLRDAQRDWIAYRDSACTAQSLLYRGGTMQNLEYYACLESQTRRRTEDLRYFGEIE